MTKDEPQIRPYERYGCQGRYLEPRTAWAGNDSDSESLCMRCDLKYDCWAMKNQITVGSKVTTSKKGGT